MLMQKCFFGPINVGETFERTMDISFRGLINRSMVVYLDAITVYSKNQNDHIPHLKEIFERCRQYRISLNTKKIFFAIEEGKILDFVIFPNGIMINVDKYNS